MRKLITICVVACLMLVASSVQVNLINGSFEISGLTDWKTVIPSGASTSIVTSHSESVPPGTSTTSWTPTDGRYFALLETNRPGSKIRLYRSFAANKGLIMAFDYFCDSMDYVPYNDTAAGLGGPVVSTLFSHSINSDLHDYRGAPWTSVRYAFAVEGTYTMLIDMINGLDSYVDNVRLIPTPGTVVLGSICVSIVG